ncbi:30S ribosomal protein S4 [archaeon]|nr:30S ribosomal protein S4 [archaeon]
MGDIKKIKKNYSPPRHPWEKERIEDEKKILLEYGLKNKTEIWKMNSILKDFTGQAKNLIALKSAQGEREKTQLLGKLQRLGILKAGASLDDVLSLNLKNILERRLQTLVFRKGLAKTARQARQFISHEHVTIGNKTISAPAYLVSVNEENGITFISTSELSNPDHPERIEKKPSKEKITVKEEKPVKQKAEVKNVKE